MHPNYPLACVKASDSLTNRPSGLRSSLHLFRSGLFAVALVSTLATSVANAAPGTLPKAVAQKVAARPRNAAPQTFVPTGPRRVRLDFVDADVQEVFRALAAQTRANIVVSPDVKGVITASLRGMSVEEALDAISRMTGVSYRKVDDTYFVASKARLDEMFAAPSVTQTYSVKSGDPAELAAVVKAAIPTLTEAVTAGKSLLVLKGPGEAVEKAMAILPSLDVNTTPEAPKQITRIKELHHIDAASTVKTLSEMFANTALAVSVAPDRSFPQAKITGGSTSTTGGGTATGQDTLTQASTAILITGPVDLVERATEMVSQLDTAPRQFEIQARVLDINTSKLAQRGIKWDYSSAFNFKEGNPVANPAGGFTPNYVSETTPGRAALRVGTLLRTSPLSLAAVIPPLINTGEARVLAEPSIRVIENRSARIFIGDTITAVVDRVVTPTGTNITTKEFTPGITLVVAGQGTSDGEITLDVRPTVSFLTSLAVEGVDIPVPQIRERSAQTTIRMKDGDTMVLGGLIQDQDIQNMTKVPILGDIPFFGNLFRSRSIDKRRSEVVIFLTAKLLK